MPHPQIPLLRALLLPALIALLAGCAVSRQDARAARVVMTQSHALYSPPPCAAPDHCAAPSSLLELARANDRASTATAAQNTAILLDAPDAALAARLNLIAGARHSIDVQTYLWSFDDVGNLMLDALLRAAQRGVTVRILADQLFSFPNVGTLAALARSNPHLHVRLYNPTFDEARTQPLQWAAGIVCCYFRFNQRMHDKLLLVDGRVGIVGGRNYENRYFGWDASLDYLDRDVLLAGPVARIMRRSFDVFWHNPRALPLPRLRDVSQSLRVTGAEGPPWTPPPWQDAARVAAIERDAADPEWMARHVLAHAMRVGAVEYYSDLPAKTADPGLRSADKLTQHLMDVIGGARHELLMQTPYLVLSDHAYDLLRRLHRERPALRMTVSTNSLASTDAFAVYAISYKHRKRYIKRLGLQVYELMPRPSAEMSARVLGVAMPQAGAAAPIAPERAPVLSVFDYPAPLLTPGPRISLHAKSYVIDGRIAVIGSHNFDPRSDHYNTENGVIIDDAAFAQALRTSILRATHPDNAWVVARRDNPPLLGPISRVLGDISAALPIFDFWPFRYATDWQKKPDCPPLLPSDPRFRQCYEPVGDFPEVNLSGKAIYTRIITAFGVGFSGIM